MKKWEMEIEEVELVLEKIWDLHDKLSDTIHSISRTHFAKSLKTPNNFNNNNGFVFVKDFDKNSSTISEAKSLNSIRSALENLEDQLEFFHTVQAQQRAERETAITQLEQSRIILALRLAEHHGKNYKVIDEAINFVGDVRNATSFARPEPTAPAEHSTQQRRVSPNLLMRVLLSGFDTAKKTLSLNKVGGVLGNTALFALSMIALLHLHRVTYKDHKLLVTGLEQGRTKKKLTRVDGFFSETHLDVRLARG